MPERPSHHIPEVKPGLVDPQSTHLPLSWVLSEASHPIALSYNRLIDHFYADPPILSLFRIQDCMDLLTRYACIIQLSNRFALLGENSKEEIKILQDLYRPTSETWLSLLQRLAEDADRNNWNDVRPIYQWLHEGGHGQEGHTILEQFHIFHRDVLLPGVTGRKPTPEKIGEESLPGWFEKLNRLISRGRYLRSWTLLHRHHGKTKAWMGLDSPRDTHLSPPKRYEGHFILYWGRRRFLSLSPFIYLLAGPYAEERYRGYFRRERIGKFYELIQTYRRDPGIWVGLVKKSAKEILEKTAQWGTDTLHLARSLGPLRDLISSEEPVTQEELTKALDILHQALSKHQFTRTTSEIAVYLRQINLLPNQHSTENLIRFLVDQILKRSPIHVPDFFVSEFWKFFQELKEEPEMKGLMEINFEVIRYLLRIYEPLLVDLVNLLKETRRIQQEKAHELVEIKDRLSMDLQIFKRQIQALRHIKTFLATEPSDYTAQARIVAQMVREFGPFFIKFAQVAAANADFLPKEIAKELEVFQEEVPPMPPEEVVRAIEESFSQSPSERYFNFDPAKPIQSGSIACVYLAKKPVPMNGREVLIPVVVKVARQGVEREFLLGESVLQLAILSTHYWAPHSKLAPFLKAWMDQTREWVEGFRKELNFQKEAVIQDSFSRRAASSRIWSVPKVYGTTARVVEMEYVRDAMSLNRTFATLSHHSAQGHTLKRIAENLVHCVLLQALQYGEVHGDLHPGNILVDKNGRIYLVDWGNLVTLKGKLPPLLLYIKGALLADSEKMADGLIQISSDPEGNVSRRSEIIVALNETLGKKGVVPLARVTLAEWIRAPREDLWHRVQAIPHILSNTQQLGIVVESSYLQLSRSFSALLGTYLSLFQDSAKKEIILSLVKSLVKFPYILVLETLREKGHTAGNSLRTKLLLRRSL